MNEEMPEKDVTSAPATPMAPSPSEPMKTDGGGYGKKGSWTKWLLIYVAIAIVVYGAWYLIKHNTGTTGTGY